MLEVCKSLLLAERSNEHSLSPYTVLFLSKPDMIGTSYWRTEDGKSNAGLRQNTPHLRLVLRTAEAVDASRSFVTFSETVLSEKPGVGEANQQHSDRFFVYEYRPQKAGLKSLSIALDTAAMWVTRGKGDMSFCCDRTSKPSTRAKATVWDTRQARLLSSTNHRAGSSSANEDELDVGGRGVTTNRMRPYLYSGFGIPTLKHALPWSINGPFVLTSNRETLQEIDHNHVSYQLFAGIVICDGSTCPRFTSILSRTLLLP